jgi:hypothetical protein
MNYRYSLANSGLMIGLTLLLPITVFAAPLWEGNVAILESKPPELGEVKPDIPLPAEDVEPKIPLDDVKVKPPLLHRQLSRSQVKSMTTMLQEAKTRAIKGNFSDGIGAFNEFAGGPWGEVSQELKIGSPKKYNDINARINKIDDIIRKKSKNNIRPLRLKFIKEVTNLINAVVKAGQDC